MKNVIVTGATGFIGSKLMLLFQEEGYNVIGWDRNADVNIKAVDLNNKNLIVYELHNFKPDIVVHCAGCADVRKSVENPEIDYAGNVTLTHNLLFAMHDLGLENTRFVFLSSAGVYGNPKKLPICENSPLNPLSPYAVHKVMCEELCQYFINNYNANIKIARIFSAYGAGLRKQIFWDMNSKYKLTGKLEMFGTGNESRDYIHVNDVVNSLFLLATTESDYSVFNVANGEEVSIREATNTFAKCANIPSNKITFNGIVREGDPLNWRADISRIIELGYKKTISMSEGLQDYVDWISQ